MVSVMRVVLTSSSPCSAVGYDNETAGAEIAANCAVSGAQTHGGDATSQAEVLSNMTKSSIVQCDAMQTNSVAQLRPRT